MRNIDNSQRLVKQTIMALLALFVIIFPSFAGSAFASNVYADEKGNMN